MPKIVRFAGGKARSTVSMPGLSSAAIYLGGFVPMIDGSDAAPAGTEFGVPAWGDDDTIYGFVVGFHKLGKIMPIWEEPDYAGTVTAATGELPMKYTFNAANSEASTTSGYYEQVEIMPVMSGDILEVSLWGAGAVSVDRATTTAWGTTTSSANIGVGLAVDTTYHFALLESGAAATLANDDFMTIELDGKKPRRLHRVYVQCIRAFNNFYGPE